MECSDIIVIGGGIIGLGIAWQLARKGVAVTLLERDHVAQQSSWAAAGMLAPFGENHCDGPMLDFGTESLRLYPQFLRELHEDGANAPLLSGPGTVQLAMSDDEIAERKNSATLATSHGFPSEWLSSSQVRELEPSVRSGCSGAVLSPSELHINPRNLCDAIQQAASNCGVRIFPYSEACSFEIENGIIGGVRCSGSVHCADKYIVAAGAWSAKFARQLGWDIPIFPRKGQMIRLEMPDTGLPFRHTLYTQSLYLVPRGGGIIVGATQEDVGFDRSINDQATDELFESAAAIVPALRDSRITDLWIGFRPATADSLPVIGSLPNYPNVTFATGHLRNGILLTPITAKCICAEILAGVSTIPAAFRPDRFHKVNPE